MGIWLGRRTAILPCRTIGAIPRHVKHNPLDSDQGWSIGVRACSSISHALYESRELRRSQLAGHTVAFG